MWKSMTIRATNLACTLGREFFFEKLPKPLPPERAFRKCLSSGAIVNFLGNGEQRNLQLEQNREAGFLNADTNGVS